MSDILCRWLNSELRLSKSVDPSSLSKDFANGYLIGEILHKYQLQEDFDLFLKSNTGNSKLNNFTRIEPTLQLLDVPFDLPMAQAVMQERRGAAAQLLYQLYILLQKKKKAGLTGTAMEAMQPAANAALHRVENDIYSERLRTVVKREADLKLQKIAQQYEHKGLEMYNRSVVAQLQDEQKRQKAQEEMRLRDLEKHRLARRRQHEIMTRIQTASVQIPKPPPTRTVEALEKRQQQRKKQEAQKVHMDIAQFEKNRKKLSPAVGGTSSLSPQQLFHRTVEESSTSQLSQAVVPRPEALAQANSEYIQGIRQKLEEDAAARQQREKRRRRVLVEQLKAHEAQEEAQREEQLVERLTRQSQQERRLAVQLMQLRLQKEVLRQNRIFRERQYHEQRERDFQEALEREAALARQARLDHAEEKRKVVELCAGMAAERAAARYRKHFDSCREVLEQIVDLATKAGEYRLITGNLIPVKLMREWKELLFCGKPLYQQASVEQLSSEPSPEQLLELEKMDILNNQDYHDYTSMTGEWAWPEEGVEPKPPPSNNNILGHVVLRLNNIVHPPKPDSPRPNFPQFSIRACVLGKVFSGKSTCLTRIAQVHGIHILSADVLIQEALAAHHAGELWRGSESPDSCGPSTTNDQEQREREAEASAASLDSGPLSQETGVQQGGRTKAKLSVRAQQGATVERVLRKGKAIPDELLIDMVVDAIRQVPAHSGWILDGLPVDLNQAKLLEKALGASDPGARDRKRKTHKANLALDINAPKEPPPPAPVLDLALLFDVSDGQVLDRAAKQACEEDSIVQPAEEIIVPGGEKSATAPETMETSQAQSQTQDLIPRNKSLEKRQLHHRIIAFQDIWPKMEKWFSGKQSILVRINADLEEEEVFKRVESVLYDVMMQSEKADEVALDGGKAPAASPSQTQTTPGPTESSSTLPQDTTLGGMRSRSKSISHSPKGGVQGNSRRSSMASSNESPHGATISRRPSEPAAPRPGSPKWVYVDEPLHQETPEYLVPYWENVCDSYLSSVKAVMQNLRTERILIIHYLYNIREEFKQYLGRPDLKQELVCHWQQDYNSIPEEMREDQEAKTELHQRFDDLRERLWDICDKRREAAEQERASMMGDGWLGDHTAVLINHYSTLMQVEVDRFQDSLRLLKDYYSSMYKEVQPEVGADFSCIPLLDIAEQEEGTHTNSSERATKSAERVTKSAGSKKEPEGEVKKKTKVVPLIPRRPASTEVASTKQKSTEAASTKQDPEERLLEDIYNTALASINTMVSVETQQREAEENEEAHQQMETERLMMSQASAAAASSAKDRKKGAKKKGPPAKEPSPPPPVEEDTEEVRRRAIRAKIRQEYAAALQHEESAVKVRMELVRACALLVMQSLQRKAEQAFRTMEEWLGARFLAEMNSIDQLAEVVRHHIESGSELQSELVLVYSDFFMNGDLRVVPSPPPTPRPPPRESSVEGSLTVLQLEAFYRLLHKVAPSGLLSNMEFSEVLQDLTCLNIGGNALPDTWMRLSESQLAELLSLLTPHDAEMLDWRQFLLSAAQPWPSPSLAQLLAALQRFKMADRGATGYVTEEQYLQVELWFESQRTPSVPEESSEPACYDRPANLRKFFFTLFADHASVAPRLDYVSMLLYLAARPDPRLGFTRALSVVLGRPLRLATSNRLLKSVPYMEEGMSELTEEEDEEVGGSPSGPGTEGEEDVSMAALLRVICHGGLWRSQEEHREDLLAVFIELGCQADETAPFSLLSQHPLLQDLMEAATQCQLIDIHRVLQVQQSEAEPLSSTVV